MPAEKPVVKTGVYGARLNPGFAKEIDKIADERGWSISRLVEVALKEFAAAEEQKLKINDLLSAAERSDKAQFEILNALKTIAQDYALMKQRMERIEMNSSQTAKTVREIAATALDSDMPIEMRKA